jgi:ribonuclease P protein component
MLPKKNRLPLRSKIKYLRQNGRLVQGPFFGLLYLLDSQQHSPMFAFIVSNKIDSRASGRNKIRRLLSEAIYSNIESVNPHLQAVFLTKKALVSQDFATIKTELDKIFIKIGLNIKK